MGGGASAFLHDATARGGILEICDLKPGVLRAIPGYVAKYNITTLM
jgi:hypothetical protein